MTSGDQRWTPPELDHHWLEADRRPEGVDDDTVDALGTLGEAVEWMERARGHLYEFHQMCGRVDFLLGDAADELRGAGHAELADDLETHLMGRNVLEGRWSFQIIEEYEAVYWEAVRSFADHAQHQLVGGRRHVFESEMKDRRRTDGDPAHRRRPDPGS
jgi:hypothetical protein